MSTFPLRFTTSTCVIALASFAILAFAGSAAQAQPARSTFSAGRTGGGSGGGELPFSNSTYRRPAVSPYMQLQQQGFNPMQAQNIYQTQVQPQVQQQQQQIEQQSQRRQMSKLQNQVQQIGRDTSGRQIDESIRATGHRATYMNYSHYYQ
jgi:small-conductance mechanosensitive channel